MTTHVIVMVPVGVVRHSYSPEITAADLDGRVLCQAYYPFFESAAVLLSEGASPRDTLEAWWADSPHAAMRARIGWAALQAPSRLRAAGRLPGAGGPLAADADPELPEPAAEPEAPPAGRQRPRMPARN